MRRIAGCSSFAVLTLVFVLFGLSRGEDRYVDVATVGSSSIEADVFRAKYVDYLLKTGMHDTRVMRASFLNQMIAMRLVVLEAQANGISETPAYKEHEAVVRSKLLLDAYARAQIHATIDVTVQDLKEMFVRANTQLTVRHLYASTRSEAKTLLSRLDAGEEFEALAAETFSDPVLAQTGGLVGPFTFDEMDPAFEDAAFRLSPGETSPPVRTATGYSVIRLVDKFQKPILTETEFAQRKHKLERFVRDRKQREARSEHVRELVQEQAIRFVDTTADRLLAQITGQALTPDGEEAAAWVREPLLSYGDPENRKTWTVGLFRDRAWRTDEMQRAQVRTTEHLIDFATGLVARDVMIDRAATLRLDRSRTFELALRDAMDEWTYARALENLRAGMPSSVEDGQAYLRSHVIGLRARYPVQINGDALGALSLIDNESS